MNAEAPAERRAPLILFAHGAGAPSSSRWMQAWAKRLGAFGTVVPFDYPYMKTGKKAPDRMPVLLAAHKEALLAAQAEHGAARPVVLAGKSMGSRVGCHLAVELFAAAKPVAAVMCFGYPLRAMGTGTLRAEVLQALRTPILFLQGSSDPLCPLPDLATTRQSMTAPSELLVIPGGDHSLEVRKRAAASGGPTQAEADDTVMAAIGAFLRVHLGGGAPSSGAS